ncbi:MAG: CinA family protein [Candidatus Heimdallarchaeaceae archaeon]
MRLAKQVVEILQKNNWTISTAESCTGGLLAHIITNSSGSSNYFSFGCITYSDEAKINELNIPREVIEEVSSYSGVVAELMAKGVREKAKTSFGLSTTGIAPPGDPDSNLPVGTVFIGVSTAEKTTHFRFNVNINSRIGFKKQVVKNTIKTLGKIILEDNY